MSKYFLLFLFLPFLCFSDEPSSENNKFVACKQAEIKYNLLKNEIVSSYELHKKNYERTMLDNKEFETGSSLFIKGMYLSYVDMYWFLDKLENDEY